MFQRTGITLIRVTRSVILNGFTKRLQHTQPEKGQPFYKRWFQYLNVFGMEGQSSAYKPLVVSRYHRVDKIDPSKWNIIYHDFVASRIAMIGLTSITCVVIGLAYSSVDYYINGELTSEAGSRIQRDFEELGLFAYVNGTAMVLCAFCLVRLHMSRILRIYQYKSNPEDFVMVRAGILQFYKKAPFTRSQVQILPILYEKDIYYYKLFLFGNIKINNKNAIINVESFEHPTIKSYMFGERNSMPEKLLSSSTSNEKPSKAVAAAKSKKLQPPPMF